MPVRPSVSEVIARGESAPVTPELMAQLWAIDVETLSEDQAVGYAVAMERVANAAHARRGLGVNRAVTCAPDTRQVPRELAAAGQLGAALGLGSGGTDTLIADAGQLAAMLPGTQALGLAGDLPWRKAASIASHTLGMTPAQARRVEDKVLAKAWERSPARHDAAVRRAVDQIDPDHTDRKRKDREHDIRLVTHHYGSGMGELFLNAPSEWIALTRTAADAYARRMKAAGDQRTLDLLRVHYFYAASSSYLSHGDAAHCSNTCDPLPPDPHPDEPLPPDPDNPESVTDPGPAPQPPTPTSPTQHGRPVALHVIWDLTSLLGLTNHCGLLRDSGTMLPPTAMRDLLRGGGRIRRMVIDPDTGEQLDLTPITWDLPATDGRAHRQPVVLTVTTTARLDDLPGDARAAVDAHGLGETLRELLDYPLTADDLDDQPDTDSPTPTLAAYTASRGPPR